jgi:O-acetyl-ADP-ribose deacetylase (regulator of RNase III)
MDWFRFKQKIDGYLNEVPKFPKMPPVLNQVDIPTLPLLYHIKRISVNEKPLATPSATLNAKIGLIRTDITKLHLPNGAIVNAANENLIPGGGVCGAIHSAAGPELIEECHRLNGCKTGYAKVTRAYRLPCKKIIHAVGPIYRLAKEMNEHETKLSSCYTETLKLAVGNGLTAVAFCALSTGIYGYPSYEAAGTAISAVRSFLESEDGQKLELVIFCNFEKKDEDAYSELIS